MPLTRALVPGNPSAPQRRQGSLTRKTLGRYPALSLADAREAWRIDRAKLAKGENPKAAAYIATDTFTGVMEDWLKRDQGDDRTRGEVERVLRKDIVPTLGHRRFADINRREIAVCINRNRRPRGCHPRPALPFVSASAFSLGGWRRHH